MSTPCAICPDKFSVAPDYFAPFVTVMIDSYLVIEAQVSLQMFSCCGGADAFTLLYGLLMKLTPIRSAVPELAIALSSPEWR